MLHVSDHIWQFLIIFFHFWITFDTFGPFLTLSVIFDIIGSILKLFDDICHTWITFDIFWIKFDTFRSYSTLLNPFWHFETYLFLLDHIWHLWMAFETFESNFIFCIKLIFLNKIWPFKIKFGIYAWLRPILNRNLFIILSKFIYYTIEIYYYIIIVDNSDSLDDISWNLTFQSVILYD